VASDRHCTVELRASELLGRSLAVILVWAAW